MKLKRLSYFKKSMFLSAVIFFLFSQELLAQTDNCGDLTRVSELASEISNLRILRKISCKKISREEFRRFTRQLLSEDTLPARLPYEERALKLVGLIPESYPYSRCLFDNIVSNAAAFYTPKTKSIYMPDWFESPNKLLLHEIVHALQDQHYHTKKLGTSKFIYSDDIFATASFIEGQATEAERRYTNKLNLPEDAEEVDPAYGLVTPDQNCEFPDSLAIIGGSYYDQGLEFVKEVIKLTNNQSLALAEVFSNPPRFSAEILFADRYLQGYYNNLQVRNWSSFIIYNQQRYPNQFEDSLGAFGINVLLSDVATATDRLFLAQNWYGDHFAYYELERTEEIISKGFLFWRLHWKSLRAAMLFESLFQKLIGKRIKSVIHQQVGQEDFISLYALES